MKTREANEKGRIVRASSNRDRECGWMRAGVVDHQLPDKAFDSMERAFDQATSQREQYDNWRQVMRAREYFRRECPHMLSGRVPYRFCANNYQCGACAFDQSLEEEDLAA